MEIIWTPWRMEYINSVDKKSGCFLCEKAEEDRDEENLILYRSDLNFIIMNVFPYNTGHVMVVPFRHIETLEKLTIEEASDMMGLAQKSVEVIREELGPEGFNLGINISRIAGAGIADHVHMHVVPRWAGDTNFMPVLGSTRVMPELLGETYKRLHRHF